MAAKYSDGFSPSFATAAATVRAAFWYCCGKSPGTERRGSAAFFSAANRATENARNKTVMLIFTGVVELCLYRTNRFTAAFPNWLIVCLGHLASHVLRLHWDAVQNRAISASSGISKFTSRWHGDFCGKSTPDPELIPDIYFREIGRAS